MKLEITFRDQELTWYMKYKSYLIACQTMSLVTIEMDLLNKFQKFNSKCECITEIKQIRKRLGEFVWDDEKWFNVLMDQVRFQIMDVQHQE